MHVEFLLEEPSAEAALKNLIPRIRSDVTFAFHVFNGKPDLLKELPRRLRGYRKWIPKDYRIVVLVDEDRQDCHELKARLERAATESELVTKTDAGGTRRFQVVNRIAIEELEAWFFGDTAAIIATYPRVSMKELCKPKFHNPDSIAGGTAETLERLLKNSGYYSCGMSRIEVASRISAVMEPTRNCSHSFQMFRDGVLALA